MALGRYLAAATVATAIGCSAVAVASVAAAQSKYQGTLSPVAAPSTPPLIPVDVPPPATTHRATPKPKPRPKPSRPSTSARSTPRPTPSTPRPTVSPTKAAPPPPKPPPPPAPRGSALPLGYSTGDATRVITVVASSTGSTIATLAAWTKAPGGGWLPYGPAVTAHVGSQGLTTQPSESKSATPIGSFTLTQAFGALADPGTALPYFQTNAADWWISQPGSLYNTHQHCSSGCAFTQGDPNEHLRYETPFYNYAVVIDYNRFPVPQQGAGSAFFLHVTDGTATAGCVSIPQDRLVTLMRWLAPAAHPRILIGVA